MLPALTTKPKQAVRQVKGLTNDSIDSYTNTPVGGGSVIGAATYVDNTEAASGSGTPRATPPTTGRATVNTGRFTVAKPPTGGEEGATMARVVRDRKASGEEELSLRTGDVVKVLSAKRTGYLKCEVGDEVGYVPSSYLEFLDSSAEVENGTSTATTEESQRAAEKQRKKQQKKEKRKKEKREANEASEPEEAAPVSVRSPRKEVANVEDEGVESPRKRKKKDRKPRHDRETGEDTHRGAASSVDEPPTTARSRAANEDTEQTRRRSKHAKKKRHHDVDSSESSESDGGGKRSARHSRRRRHRRGSSASDSDSTYSDDSDGSYRRRRRRRRHRHRRNSSDDEDEDDSDYKRRSRRSKKRRDKDDDSEPEEGSRSARKAEKKKVAAAVHEVEKGVSQLEIKAEEKPSESRSASLSSRKEEPDRDRGKKEETIRSEGSSEGRATNLSLSRKDDEGRTSSGTSSSKQNGTKAGLGRQIGEKMRSFLGGNKKQHSSKSSSGILNACAGTVQGEEGWYEHGENERYYFVLVDGKWSLLYGPMTEEDFEIFSSRVIEQNHAIELPPTYLHKSGYYLNRELRVQKEQ